MYLFFSDWSSFTGTLDRKGIPHGGRIIKAYGLFQDPREVFNKPQLIVINQKDSRFDDNEIFRYSFRGVYTGSNLEDHLDNLRLPEEDRRRTRALFRLANREGLEFCQFAMGIRVNNQWLIEHPLHDLHGVKESQSNPEFWGRRIHLDIFADESLQRLKTVVDFNNPELLADKQDISRTLRSARIERQ